MRNFLFFFLSFTAISKVKHPTTWDVALLFLGDLGMPHCTFTTQGIKCGPRQSLDLKQRETPFSLSELEDL